MVMVSLGSKPPGDIRGDGPWWPKKLSLFPLTLNINIFSISYCVFTVCWLKANWGIPHLVVLFSSGQEREDSSATCCRSSGATCCDSSAICCRSSVLRSRAELGEASVTYPTPSTNHHLCLYKLFSTLIWLLGITLYSRMRNLCQSHFWRHYECERKIMSSFLFMLFFAFSWVTLLFRYTTLFSAKKVSLYAKLTDLHLRDFILIKIKVPDSFKATLWEKV